MNKMTMDYYLKDMNETTRLAKQKKALEGLTTMLYKPFIGLVINKAYLDDSLDRFDLNQTETKVEKPYLTLSATILAVYVKYGLKKRLSNYRIKLEITGTCIIKDLPLKAIMNWYRSGFPRDGKDPRYYTDYPWKLLKPMKAYLAYEIALKSFKERAFKDQIHEFSIYKDYYESTLSRILNQKEDTSTFRVFIKEKYDLWVQTIMKEVDKDHLSPITNWMYTGIIYKDITEESFIPDTQDDNPFVDYELNALAEMKLRFDQERKHYENPTADSTL
ncbi:MAG: hypothetical protein RBQ91_07625 [Acholeplasma sp.]|nr:hypothetical protein [Acholeplasma sp.]